MLCEGGRWATVPGVSYEIFSRLVVRRIPGSATNRLLHKSQLGRAAQEGGSVAKSRVADHEARRTGHSPRESRGRVFYRRRGASDSERGPGHARNHRPSQ
jgi:hypothetical protein